MKRREFLLTPAALAGAMLPRLSGAEAQPCAPRLSVSAAGTKALVERIRQTATQPTGAGLPHPLPLASHWNAGFLPDGFDPMYQVAQLQQGRYVLPWFHLRRPEDELANAYFEPALREWSRLKMPLSFVCTQWEVIVAEAQSGAATWGRTNPLSPISPVDAWYTAGRRWGESRQLRWLQEVYPDPPLVLFVSNNEQPRMTWIDVKAAGMRLPGWSPGASDAELRRAVGNAWIQRYRQLLRGFREGLASDQWRARAKFVGYDAFGQFALGRWPGWPEYSLHVPGRFEPWSSAWDGASVSYYTSDWNQSSDFRVFSPQIEWMNLVPMLDQARQRNANFWFEMSAWDGRSDGLKTDKDDFYRALGQRWDPQRYAGMVKFGLWLLRPRVVREFRDPDSPRSRYAEYFDVILDAIGQVHDEPTLARFWHEGRLVANTLSAHPYQSSIPADLQGTMRWFLLEADANPPRPWTVDTPLDVFALALATGTSPSQEWLVYAHAPLAASRTVQVTLTPTLRPKIIARRSGSFSIVRERDGSVWPLTC